MVHDVQAAGQRAPAPLDEEASPCLAAGEDKSSLGGRPNPADGSSALPCSNLGGWKRFLVAQHSQALANWRCIARLWPKGSRRQAFCAHVRVLSWYLRWPLPCLAELGAATADIRPRTHGRDLSEYLAPYQAMMAKRSEEHTSELQSRLHLVCRLLLEKKNKQTMLAD